MTPEEKDAIRHRAAAHDAYVKEYGSCYECGCGDESELSARIRPSDVLALLAEVDRLEAALEQASELLAPSAARLPSVSEAEARCYVCWTRIDFHRDTPGCPKCHPIGSDVTGTPV